MPENNTKVYTIVPPTMDYTTSGNTKVYSHTNNNFCMVYNMNGDKDPLVTLKLLD